MNTSRTSRLKTRLTSAASLAALSIIGTIAYAQAETVDFDIEAQPLAKALNDFSAQADIVVMASGDLVAGKTAPAIDGIYAPNEALHLLLNGSGLETTTDTSGAIVITQVSAEADTPQTFQLAQVDQERTVREIDAPAEEDAEARQDVIVVTGTNIRGLGSTASPSITFDRDDLIDSGASSTQEFIQRSVVQNFSAGASEDIAFGGRSDSGSNVGSGAGINLRGLGNDATLVLLNGRRLAPAGQGTFVDVSLIPLSALERIEIVTDGASAIYGSDAVGGVANFILRDELEGAETRVRLGTVTDGGRDEFQASQSLGANWETGNAFIAYEFSDQDRLGTEERSFSEGSGDPTDLLPSQERHSVFATANQNLSDAVNLFGTAFYSNRQSSFFSDPLESGDSEVLSDNEQYGGFVGLTVDIGSSWQAEVVGNYSKTSVVADFIDLPAGTLDFSRSSDFETWTIDAKIDGTLFTLPGGEVKAAVGGQHRSEEFDGLTVRGGGDRFSDDRSVDAVFGEVFVPIVGEQNARPGLQRLEVTGAVRHESYSDFGSSTDPKFGLLWSPADSLSFRGTYGTSFRAPQLVELDESDLQVIFFDFPDPDSPDGATLAMRLNGTNPTLQPEVAETWTVGFDFEPKLLDRLKLSVSYYNIQFDDRIASSGASFFGAFGNPIFFDIIDRDPDPAFVASLAANPGFIDATQFAPGGPFDPADTEAIVDNRLRNLSSTDVDGIDFRVDYSLQNQLGDFGFFVNGNYIFNFDEQLTSTSPVAELVDTVFNPSDFRMRSGVNWSKDAWSSSVFVNYVDSYTDNLSSPEVSVDSWTTVDARLSYNTGSKNDLGFLNDLVIAVSVQNIFDEDPPFVADAPPLNIFGLGFDPENADPLGRFVAFEITKNW